MTYFLIPKQICYLMDKYQRHFWWSQQNHENRINWISWRKLRCPISGGGMIFRDLHLVNLALLAKQRWRLLSNPNSLWVRLLKSIYFPHSDFLHVPRKKVGSWGWNSLMVGREVIKKGCMWMIKDGESIALWNDPWIKTLPNRRLSSPPSNLVSLKVKISLTQIPIHGI